MNLAKLFAPYTPPMVDLVEQVRYWALAKPEVVAFRFLPRGGADEMIELTYKELDERAKAIAAKLVSMGLVGGRALMMYPPGMEFVEAFLACHYAGVVPVPAFPPRRNRNMSRIDAISENAQAIVVLSTTVVTSRSDNAIENAPALRRIPWVTTETIPNELAGDWVKPNIDSNGLGLIQYTSGSTGTPKGVMLTHKNIMANCAMISSAFGMKTREMSNAVIWLPAYHDMGLIGGVLNTMFLGSATTLMSPVTFLTRPLRWLMAISDYDAQISGGPNFAYRWCCKKISHEECEKANLDLSSWKVAFNGAEPVRADVMAEFTEKFGRYGFNHNAHYPCYGMAETALIVSGGSNSAPPVIRWFDKERLVQHHVAPVEENAEHASSLVGCGQVIPPEELLIVHPEKREKLADDKIGEIWIHSPSSGQGYWNRPKESAEVFRSRLKQDNGKEYVRSGDLGFLYEGELFITGRLKDMIIVRGVNRYPQDIEATVEDCDECLRSGGSAAFAIDHWDREHLVVICEIERQKGADFDSLLKKIRASVIAEHDLPPDAIVLVRTGSIPKTSSGKVQRHACRDQFEKDTLNTIARWSALEDKSTFPEKSTRKTFQNEVEESGIDPGVIDAVKRSVTAVGKERARILSLDTNIVVDVGLDSLERLEIARELESSFGGRFPEEVLQEIETIRDVAQALQDHIGTEQVKPLGSDQPETEEKPTPDSIPESYYQIDKMPEFVRFNRMREMIESTGVRNPFFSVHEGRIGDTTMIDGKKLISYASYNYLGMSGHPNVAKAAKDAIEQFGTSVSASRIVSGEKTLHKQLENELADFLGVEDIITFPGGHATNESVIGHMVGPGDLIIHDALAHNSIIQGAELSGARRRPFAHNDWRGLDTILKKIRHDYRRVMIAVEGLYSMDGDFPDMPRFVDIKKQHKCWLYIDEAHSIGTMGATGRGIAEVFGIDREDVECWMGTLSKSFGSCGGFIGGKSDLIDFLRYTTPGFVFAAGMPPANAGAALGALREFRDNPEPVKKLQSNSRLFLDLARAAGLDTGMAQGTPIIPLITSSSIKALRLAEALYNDGINAQPILHPAVRETESRVRIFMTAIHTEEQIRESVDIIAGHYHDVMNGKLTHKTETVANGVAH